MATSTAPPAPVLARRAPFSRRVADAGSREAREAHDRAATLIGAFERGAHERTLLRKKREAALLIERVQRGHRTRRGRHAAYPAARQAAEPAPPIELIQPLRLLVCGHEWSGASEIAVRSQRISTHVPLAHQCIPSCHDPSTFLSCARPCLPPSVSQHALGKRLAVPCVQLDDNSLRDMVNLDASSSWIIDGCMSTHPQRQAALKLPHPPTHWALCSIEDGLAEARALSAGSAVGAALARVNGQETLAAAIRASGAITSAAATHLAQLPDDDARRAAVQARLCEWKLGMVATYSEARPASSFLRVDTGGAATSLGAQEEILQAVLPSQAEVEAARVRRQGDAQRRLAQQRQHRPARVGGHNMASRVRSRGREASPSEEDTAYEGEEEDEEEEESSTTRQGWAWPPLQPTTPTAAVAIRRAGLGVSGWRSHSLLSRLSKFSSQLVRSTVQLDATVLISLAGASLPPAALLGVHSSGRNPSTGGEPAEEEEEEEEEWMLSCEATVVDSHGEVLPEVLTARTRAAKCASARPEVWWHEELVLSVPRSVLSRTDAMLRLTLWDEDGADAPVGVAERSLRAIVQDSVQSRFWDRLDEDWALRSFGGAPTGGADGGGGVDEERRRAAMSSNTGRVHAKLFTLDVVGAFDELHTHAGRAGELDTVHAHELAALETELRAAFQREAEQAQMELARVDEERARAEERLEVLQAEHRQELRALQSSVEASVEARLREEGVKAAEPTPVGGPIGGEADPPQALPLPEEEAQAEADAVAEAAAKAAEEAAAAAQAEAEKEQQEILRVFNEIDEDGSGDIDAAELKGALKALGLDVDVQASKSVLQKYTESDTLDLKEFGALVQALQKSLGKTWQQAAADAAKAKAEAEAAKKAREEARRAREAERAKRAATNNKPVAPGAKKDVRSTGAQTKQKGMAKLSAVDAMILLDLNGGDDEVHSRGKQGDARENKQLRERCTLLLAAQERDQAAAEATESVLLGELQKAEEAVEMLASVLQDVLQDPKRKKSKNPFAWLEDAKKKKAAEKNEPSSFKKPDAAAGGAPKRGSTHATPKGVEPGRSVIASSKVASDVPGGEEPQDAPQPALKAPEGSAATAKRSNSKPAAATKATAKHTQLPGKAVVKPPSRATKPARATTPPPPKPLSHEDQAAQTPEAIAQTPPHKPPPPPQPQNVFQPREEPGKRWKTGPRAREMGKATKSIAASPSSPESTPPKSKPKPARITPPAKRTRTPSPPKPDQWWRPPAEEEKPKPPPKARVPMAAGTASRLPRARGPARAKAAAAGKEGPSAETPIRESPPPLAGEATAAETEQGLEEAVEGAVEGAAEAGGLNLPPELRDSFFQLRNDLKLQFTTVRSALMRGDEDGNSRLSRVEWINALPKMGLLGEDSQHKAMELFDLLDADSSGELDFRELHAALRQGASVQLDTALKAGAVPFEVRRTKSPPAAAGSRTSPSPPRPARKAGREPEPSGEAPTRSSALRPLMKSLPPPRRSMPPPRARGRSTSPPSRAEAGKSAGAARSASRSRSPARGSPPKEPPREMTESEVAAAERDRERAERIASRSAVDKAAAQERQEKDKRQMDKKRAEEKKAAKVARAAQKAKEAKAAKAAKKAEEKREQGKQDEQLAQPDGSDEQHGADKEEEGGPSNKPAKGQARKSKPHLEREDNKKKKRKKKHLVWMGMDLGTDSDSD